MWLPGSQADEEFLLVSIGGGGINTKVRRMAMLSIMLSIMYVVSTLEHMLPPFPLMPPHTRIGLANVVVMYAVFFIGIKEAFALNILKAALITLSRGPTAGILSLAGGMLSVCVIAILVKTLRNRVSVVMISVTGSMAHNIGQLTVFSFFVGITAALYYLPFLMIASIFLGVITGIVLNVILPVLKR